MANRERLIVNSDKSSCLTLSQQQNSDSRRHLGTFKHSLFILPYFISWFPFRLCNNMVLHIAHLGKRRLSQAILPSAREVQHLSSSLGLSLYNSHTFRFTSSSSVSLPRPPFSNQPSWSETPLSFLPSSFRAFWLFFRAFLEPAVSF